MATQKQIEANRRNALKSTGPTSSEGKEDSRRNSLKHGLTGEGVAITAADEARAADRNVGFREALAPGDAVQDWLVEGMAIDSVRIDRCRQEEFTVRKTSIARAELAWEQDREAEAARLGARLAKNPEAVYIELSKTLHGARWLKCRWELLLAALDDGGDWDDDQASLALDLMATPAIFRSPGRSPIDPPSRSNTDRREHHLAIALKSIASLTDRIDGPLAELDADDRDAALSDLALTDNPRLTRLRRYEAALQRRFDRARQGLDRKEPAASAAPRSVPPAPVPEAADLVAPKTSAPDPVTEGLLETIFTEPERATTCLHISAVPPRHLNRRQRRALVRMV